MGCWVEVSAYPSSGGLSVYFRDITGRKAADEALRESEEFNRRIVLNRRRRPREG
jgi:hypothetical protein